MGKAGPGFGLGKKGRAWVLMASEAATVFNIWFSKNKKLKKIRYNVNVY